jgi:hypothetical protein
MLPNYDNSAARFAIEMRSCSGIFLPNQGAAGMNPQLPLR